MKILFKNSRIDFCKNYSSSFVLIRFMAFPFVTIVLRRVDSNKIFFESVCPLVNIYEMKRVGKYPMNIRANEFKDTSRASSTVNIFFSVFLRDLCCFCLGF